MQATIVHQVPGRLRLRIPEIGAWTGAGDWIQGPVFSRMGVQSVRVNTWCASVIICYDAAIPGVVERILSMVASLSLDALSEAPVSSKGQSASMIKRAVRAVASFFRSRQRLLWASAALVSSLAGGWMGIAAAPLICVTSLPTLQRAWTVMYGERRLNVDFLDTAAVLVSMGRGQFFTAAFIAWMISLGDFIRDRTAMRSKRMLSDLLQFRTITAWVLRDGKLVRLPSALIRTGDLVSVYPGEMIPVDGAIENGQAIVDQKSVTGESLPVERCAGERVFAATVLREGRIDVRAMRTGEQTTAAQMVHLVESAPIGETRIQNYAEKFGDRLVAPSLALSGSLYAASGNLDRLLSMLIIDFGTGIRVAAPTAVLAGIARAARNGILIKAGRYVERLAQLDTLVFDKTGTLTHGRPEIHGIASLDERGFPERTILSLAAAAEMRLRHPVSKALVAKAQSEGIDIPEQLGSRFDIGMGVEARVNGYHVHVGSERFFTKKQIACKPGAAVRARAAQKGWSTLLFAVDGVIKGIISYADRIRRESRDVITALRNTGVRNVVMMTGDTGPVARAVAGQLGIKQYYAEALPASKSELIRQMQRNGYMVGMVGDGINDSAALAYADIGIAVKHGEDVARETADVVLMEDNLWKLIAAVEISRGVMRKIRQNYAIIAGLNALALLLAIPQGLINPNVSALLSNGSAILASLNAIGPPLGE